MLQLCIIRDLPVLTTSLRLIVLSAALTLGGCAATVTKNGPTPPLVGASPGAKANLHVQVQAAPHMQYDSGWGNFLADWREGMAVAAGRTGARLTWPEKDSAGATTPGVLVTVTVQSYRYVTREQRMLKGMFADDAFVNVLIEYRELPDRKLLGSRSFSTSSHAIEGLLTSTTHDQVLALSDDIIAELR